MRYVIALLHLFFAFAVVQVIPYFGSGPVADELLALHIVLAPASFHNIAFTKSGRKIVPENDGSIAQFGLPFH